MKFGNYLEERKANLPAKYVSHCIDYRALKQFLKTEVYAHSIRLNNVSSDACSFAQLVSDRLCELQKCQYVFIQKLDAEVDKITTFFDVESQRLVALSQSNDSQSDEAQLLKSIITLERFVFLNYTGIIKILKKNDRHSGLSFVRADQLTKLKRSVMNRFTTVDVPAYPPLMVRSRSNNTAATALPPVIAGPNQQVLVSLSGPHGTDIVGAVLDCLARHPCRIEDVMISRLYHNVTFGVLITLQSDSISIFRDLAEAAQKWDAILTYDVPDSQTREPQQDSPVVNYTKPASLEEAPYSERDKYTATLLNQNGLVPEFLSQWTRLLLKHRISLSCADFKLSVPRGLNMIELRRELFDLSTKCGTDIAFQKDDIYRKNKRLVVFDMDSTLIYQEVIDEIARYAGVVDQVSSITELAMNGEIDFKESLRRRVALLKGVSVSVLENVRQSLTFTEGAKFLCRALKKLGFKLAVISGGFMPLALYVKSELGLDYAFANQLEVSSDGLTLTGKTVGPIVDGIRKAELLEVIAQAEGLSLKQVIAVGDGANDLWMLNKASLGIAFNAKPRVQEQAGARINQQSLKYVLMLLGYTEQEMREL
ncbi:HAD-like domain-containing protein [Cokeromyces recurvatus]|uniref:HAD-like domain-containing protein n=1 Tax=Cokeromyces recurvatus TaxID=90255 RepID=UPI00222041BD|nr:HAD-like domain-containing protein [Cokeromyces recurvatus]KAI7900110.1 HAD-like domain-containing protein [Cokeromyces recurvatus]